MKKFTAALCTVLLLIGAVLVPGAAAAGPALANTRAYCIMDADTGLVLAQQNMDEELHPASITKVMTLGLACEKAQGDWDDVKLTVSHEDVYSLAGTDSSHIALREGEEVPLADALYATQMASANDGANLLAEYFGGGTIADGVAAMNAQVEELGLAHTHFSNPHGISDDDHYTSCYDMAQILRWALQQPGFEDLFTRNEMYTMQPTNIQPVTRYFSQQDKIRIGCVGTAFRLYKQMGEPLYCETMRLIVAAWEGKPDSFRASVLKGMMHFVELYHGEFSEERLLRALRNIHPVDIYRIGQDDPAKLRGWKKYVFPIYTAYNGKCRKDALPMKF